MLSNISKKWLIISTVILITLGIGSFIKIAIDNMYLQPHGYLEIISVPEEVSYSFKDTTKTITSGKKRPVPIGEYEIIFSAEGFKAMKKTVNIKDTKTTSLGVQLTPESDAAKNEAKDKKYDRAKEYTTADRMDAQTAVLEKNNPIIDKLPLQSQYYTAEQCQPFRKETISRGNIGICIQILEPSIYTDVLEQLSSGGNDLDKYDILFNDDFIYPNSAERAAGVTFTLIDSVDYGHGEEDID